jgi:hypothetical protein
MALWKSLSEPAKILFQAAHHDGFELSRFDLLSADEALRIEDFHQGGKTVRVPVMGRRGQKQPMFEPRRQFPDRLCNLRVDRVFAAARRRSVMRLVEDQQRPGPKFTKRIEKPGSVSAIDQKPVRDEKPATGSPWIHRKTAFPPHLGEKRTIEDRETQPEASLQLIRPLPQHRGRRCYDDEIDPSPQQQLTQDQAGLDRFTEADIIGDQQINPRQQKRLT